MIILGITTLAFVLYLYYVILFQQGLRNVEQSINYEKPFVSVVIAARNEEENIGRLLTALVNQTYYDELYEVIIADDDSSDRTAEIVREFSAKFEFVKLLEVTGREDVISPKKNALSQAIAVSKGKIILSTDADCMVGKHWLKAMVENFSENDFVAGFSRIELPNWRKSSFLQKLEFFDFFAMFSAAAGAISKGKPFSCSGQNISCKKEAFNDVQGFEKIAHLVSGDDVNLMQLMRKNGKKIGFAFSPHSYVYTKPVDNWSELFNQRSRWASNMKWQISLNSEFFLYLLVVFWITVIPFALLFINFWFGLSIILLRASFEYNFLRKSFELFKEDKARLRLYPLWFILQPFYMILVALLGALNIFNWKR